MGIQPRYRIEIDPRRNYVRLIFSGHMDMATMADFEKDIILEFGKLAAAGGRSGCCLILVDVRDQSTHSKDVEAKLQTVIAHHIPPANRTALILSGSTLQKMQSKRGGQADAYFLDEDEALAWLFAI